MELGRMIRHRSRHREITLVETIVPDLTLDLEWMRIHAKDPIIVKNAVALRSTRELEESTLWGMPRQSTLQPPEDRCMGCVSAWIIDACQSITFCLAIRDPRKSVISGH